MKFLKSYLIFILLSGSAASASVFSAALDVDSNGYQLNIRMEFSKPIPVREIRRVLQSEYFSQEFNNKLVKMSRMYDTDNDYALYQRVSSFFVKTDLYSKCQESLAPLTWTRQCNLDTQIGDGGKFMAWKNDLITCSQYSKAENSFCEVKIEGLARDMKLLSFTILEKKRFMVLAKKEALDLFARQWAFLASGSVAAKISNQIVDTPDFSKNLRELTALAFTWNLPEKIKWQVKHEFTH